MKILLTPLLYLRVKHERKASLDFWLPLIVSVTFVVLVHVTASWWIVFRPPSGQTPASSFLADRLIALLSALSAFYVAALAAIATFNGKNLDEVMAGDPPTLRHGKYKNEPERLTRRRFLSLLFGYLAFASFLYTIFLVLAPVVGQITHGALEMLSGSKYYFVSKALYLIITLIYTFCFFQIMSITFIGLHYLSERMSRE